ncbi:MAG: hypothetical protein ACFE0Q_15455 [Anaerolineae bacterium]
MPKLSVWLVKASLIHMGVGFLFGALILFHKGIAFYGGVWKLLNPHIALMIFGWTMQLIIGVAFFALPRFSNRDSRYGAVHLGWGSFYLFNAGIVISALAYWFGNDANVLIGHLLILLGTVTYVLMIWPRVKPFAVG